MSRFQLCLLAASLIFNACCEALLPPLYQSMDEYTSLLTNQQFIDKLDSADSILDIRRDPQGFTVTTMKKIIKVELIYEPAKHPGPAKFHFEIQSIQNNEK